MIGLPKRPVEIIVASVLAAACAISVVVGNVFGPIDMTVFGSPAAGGFTEACEMMFFVLQCVTFGTSLIAQPVVRSSAVVGTLGAMTTLGAGHVTASLAFVVLGAVPLVIQHALAKLDATSIPLAISRRHK